MQYRQSNTFDADGFYTYWFEKNLQGDIIAVYTVDGRKICTYTYVNAVNYSKIDEELQDSYTEDEAIEEINNILGADSKDDRVTFNYSGVKIIDLYQVTSRYDRQKISEVIHRTGKTNRKYDNMSAEWLGHNICYRLHIKIGSTKDMLMVPNKYQYIILIR